MLAGESAFWLRDFRLNPQAGQPSWFLVYLPNLGNLVKGAGPSDLRKALLVAWGHDGARVAELDALSDATLAQLMQWVRARVRHPNNERVYLIMDQYNSLTVPALHETQQEANVRSEMRQQVDAFAHSLRDEGCIVLQASSANNSDEWVVAHELAAQRRQLITLFGGFSQVSNTRVCPA